MERFCFPVIIKDQPKEEDYKTITIEDSSTNENVTYIEMQALKDMKDSQQLINLSIINTDKLITWVSDLYITWPIILASLAWTFVIALIYLFFVRFCAGFIVYLTILLVLGCFIVLGYFFHDRANLYDSVDDSMYHSTMIGLGWFCYALAIIWFLVIVVLCNRIRLAANMMEVTAKYIHANCCIFFVPFFFFILTGAWYAYWVIISIYLYSTGEMKGATVIANIEWDNKTRYAWWFHLFALFYMNEFLKALAQFVYASSACIWYFSHDKGTDEKPIKTSFKRAFRYHLGSLAFGSLIVAIIRFIMFFMEYIKKKVDKTVGQKTKQGKIYRCIICCCQCCMNCVARTMEFINKHAYVQIALKGENFCKSAWEGFGIIVRNLGRFSTLFLIGGFFNLFGMIFIAASSGMIGYLLITNIDTFADKISSPVLPTFTMVMIGFVIGMVCLSVFGTSSDALMHAFLLDEEINKGQPKNFPELQKFMEDEK